MIGGDPACTSPGGHRAEVRSVEVLPGRCVEDALDRS